MGLLLLLSAQLENWNEYCVPASKPSASTWQRVSASEVRSEAAGYRYPDWHSSLRDETSEAVVPSEVQVMSGGITRPIPSRQM
jgi:hypothetical protein